jgi:cytochrome c553
MKRILIAIATASIAFTANAADLKKGEELVNKSGCIACHGEGLNKPLAPEYPILAGQHADYLYAALKAYKVTNNPNIGRNNAIMAGQVAQFSNKDLQDIAAYISTLPGSLVMKK